MSSGKDNWQTPAEILDLVRRLGDIAYDPCPGSGDLVAAHHVGVDGLTERWLDYEGLIYVNPPYSSLLVWAKKIAEEGRRGCEIVTLTPARTDTRAFHEHLAQADLFCFLRGRLHFRNATGETGPAPFPSLICYWGDNVNLFFETFCKRGVVMR